MNSNEGSARFGARPPEGDDPVRTPRIFEAICEQVRTQLSQGKLTTGDKLPAERDLAVQFGSSRTAVREALRSLEMAGVIELRKGVKGGAFIREGDPAVVTRSFGDMVHLGRISLENLTESRVIIQDAVIRLACKRGTVADFDGLEQSIARTEQLTREQRYDERRLQLVGFYRLLAQATRNEVMVIIVDALTDIVLKVLARDSTVPRQDTVKAQRAIVVSLRRRNADQAAQLMARHLKALHGHLLQAAALREQQGGADQATAARPMKTARLAKLASKRAPKAAKAGRAAAKVVKAAAQVAPSKVATAPRARRTQAAPPALPRKAASNTKPARKAARA